MHRSDLNVQGCQTCSQLRGFQVLHLNSNLLHGVSEALTLPELRLEVIPSLPLVRELPQTHQVALLAIHLGVLHLEDFRRQACGATVDEMRVEGMRQWHTG